MSPTSEFAVQVAETLGGPTKRGLGIAPGRGLDEGDQIASEGGVLGDGALSNGPGATDVVPRFGVIESADHGRLLGGKRRWPVDLGDTAPTEVDEPRRR